MTWVEEAFFAAVLLAVQTERFYSVAGHLVSKKRARFKPDIINDMSFLAYKHEEN